MKEETKKTFLILIYFLVFILAMSVVILIIKNIFNHTQSLITAFIVISILGYALYFTRKEKKDIEKQYEQLLRYSYKNIKKKKAPEILDNELVYFEEEFKDWLMDEEIKRGRKKK